MIMDKLYHYCANNQKTGDPEWELMPSALESMVDSYVAAIEPVDLLHSRLPQSSLQCTGMGIIHLFSKHSHIFIICDMNFCLFEIHPDFKISILRN